MNQNTTLPDTPSPLGKWAAEQRAMNPPPPMDAAQSADFDKKLTELQAFKDGQGNSPTPT
jgi:hypothetical protein